MAKKPISPKPPKDETKSEKFVRVVLPRVSKAVKSIKLIANCSGGGYEYTEAQAKEITTALCKAVDFVTDSFTTSKKTTDSFKFKE